MGALEHGYRNALSGTAAFAVSSSRCGRSGGSGGGSNLGARESNGSKYTQRTAAADALRLTLVPRLRF